MKNNNSNVLIFVPKLSITDNYVTCGEDHM